MYSFTRIARSGNNRGSAGLYLLVAFLGAIIGGLIVTSFVPGYVAERVAATLPQPKLEAKSVNLAAPGQSPDSNWLSPVVYVAEKVGPSVVRITNRSRVSDFWGRTFYQTGSGSGVIYRSDGYIVTNNHVVEGASELTVTLADGRNLPAKLVGRDPTTDLAVLKIDASNLPAAEFGDSDKLKLGELAVAIGSPLGKEFQNTVTAGVISGLNRTLTLDGREFRLIQTDAAINPGNSGGPLVNAAGQVIGINTVKITSPDGGPFGGGTPVEGMGFAIPINTARPIISALMEKGRVVRPWIGIQIVEKEEAAQQGINFDHGILIWRVVPGSPAAMAGLKDLDVLVKFNGQAINSFADLRRAMEKSKVGDQVTLVVQRGQREVTVTVTLGEAPPQ